MSRVPANSPAARSTRLPSFMCACIQRRFPGCRSLYPMACAIIHRCHGGRDAGILPSNRPACISWSIRDGPLPFQTWPVGPRSRHPPSHAGPVRARPVLRSSVPWLYRATSLQDRLRTGSSVSPACAVRRASGGRCLTRPALMPPQPLSVATKAASAPCRKNAIPSVECQANGLSTSGCGPQSCHFLQ